jgi:hypothetical protein
MKRLFFRALLSIKRVGQCFASKVGFSVKYPIHSILLRNPPPPPPHLIPGSVRSFSSARLFFMTWTKRLALLATLSFWPFPGNGGLCFASNELAQTFNYQGQFFNEAGTAPLLDTVDLTLEIRDPTGTCLLYSEQQNNINLNSTNGLFSVQVGSLTSAAKRTVAPAPATELDPGFTMEQIFSNYGIITGAIANCAAGYTPSAGDDRILRVIIDDVTTSTTVTLSPDLAIGSAPQAVTAQTLQGFTPTGFIQVDSHMTQTNADTLTLGAGSDASALHNHDSLYVKLGTAATQNLGTGITYTTGDLGVGTAAPGARIESDTVAPATVGEIIKGAASQTADLLDFENSAGTVMTSVSAAGVLTIGGSPAATQGYVATQISSYLPLAGGALTGPVTNTSSYTTTGDVLFQNGTYSVGFAPPATAPAANVTWTLPAADGTANQFLQTNGSGGLQWASGSAGGITSLDGLSGSSQTFATTEAATSVAPAFTAATTVHTLNIPMASVGATTAGLLSNTDYTTFSGKAGGSSNLVDVNTLTKVSAAGAVGEATGISVLATANITNLIVKAGSAQAATDYQDWENNSGTIQYSLNSSGTPTATTDLVTKAYVTTAIGAAGGITSLNGLTGATQTFANGTTGTTPSFSSVGTTHTLEIPMASTAAVTAGLLSNTDYTAFKADVSGSSNIPAGGAGTMIVANGTAGTVSESTGITSAISTTNTDLVVKAGSAQSTDLQDWENSSGTILYSINNSGTPSASTDLATVGYVSGQNGSYLPLAGGALTGPVTSSSSYTTTGSVLFKNGAHSVGFLPPSSAPAGNLTWTLPAADGTLNQFLQTNGAGGLQWGTAAAAGITSLNGLTGATQTFANGTTGTAPSFSSVGTTHTLEIPMASTAGTTAGLIANSDYTNFSAKVNRSGDTMTGALVINTPTTPDSHSPQETISTHVATNKGLIVQGTASQSANLFETQSSAGTTLTYIDPNGNLFLNADPSSPLQAATEEYVTAQVAAAGSSYLPLAGGTLTGPLNVPANDLVVGTTQLVASGGKVGVGTATPQAPLDVNGEIRAGTSTGLACSGTTQGAIRYNTSSNALEYCNGTAWSLVQAAACTNPSPTAFSFTNLANETISTQYQSNIVQITGQNCIVTTTISGGGSPQYRICADNACGTVVQGWTSGPSSIKSGQYMQVEETTSASGGVTTQATVIVGGTASIWTVSTTGSCAGLPGTPPAVGTVCADGTVYAGLSPDAGYVPMFTTRCDLGQTWNVGSGTCTGTPQVLSWNNGTGNWTTTGFGSPITGQFNTAGLVALADAGAPYYAADDCNSLSTAGITEGSGAWYLPAQNELNVLYQGSGPIGNFNTSGQWYWSSTEYNYHYADIQRFSDGNQGNGGKSNTYLVRCVRR